MVGLCSPDDAGIYKLNDTLALVQTIDYFTPIVDDPFAFGQIAAANALSDVYAMGGIPITAMNIACFPIKKIDKSVFREILKGGMAKLEEADVVLIGGHTVDDVELKYGLSVTGIIHPEKILTKGGAKINDSLILTKPIGTGILVTALKSDLAISLDIQPIIQIMSMLNKTASEVMLEIGVNACTDITGFGFLGHAIEMMTLSSVGMAINSDKIPIFPDAIHYAEMGFIPGGTHANRKYFEKYVDFSSNIKQPLQDVLFDPQTSGGLLISVSSDKAENLIKLLCKKGITDSNIIGYISNETGKIKVL